MKGFRYTYCLLMLICIAVSSCTGDDIIDRDAEGETRISLTMNMSETGAGGNASSPYDQPEERYIRDISVYIFSKESDQFIEKLVNPLMTGSEEDAVRTIIGELKADYNTSYTDGIDIIVLTNLAARGITEPEMSKGQSKTDLYSQLSYTYAPGDDWKFTTTTKRYIPMWGTASITAIKPGFNQGGKIALYRAVARVDVLINEGKGFSHFEPKSLKITHYNDKGYCATTDLALPYIPANSNIATAGANFTQPDGAKQIYRLYIPEYKNKDASNVCKIELTGKLTTASGPIVENKTYTLDFHEGGKPIDILRNHLYRFNITKIADEVTVTSSLDYVVEKWEFISVEVPSFN